MILNDTTGVRSLEITVDSTPIAIVWNMADALAWANEYADKYRDAEVTDENLPQMVEAQKDLARKIKRLDEIRMEQKTKQMAPYEIFKTDIEKVQKALEDVRAPIAKQTQVYTDRRREQKRDEAAKLVSESVASAGLRSKFSAQLSVADSWTNLSAKRNQVKAEIEAKVSSLMELQKQEDQAAEMARQRSEMAVMMCKLQSEAAGLAIPIEPKDIYGIANLQLTELPGAITVAITRRKESEQAAIERAERQKAEAAERLAKQQADAEAARIKQAEIDAAREAIARVDAQTEAQKEIEELPFAPSAPPIGKQYKLAITLFGTEDELTGYVEILEDNGWNYAKGAKEEVK